MSQYSIGPQRDELIRYLRNELNLPKADITDTDLLRLTRGTLMFAGIELGMSLRQFWKELKSILIKEI